MWCPVCGSNDAWVRGKEKSWQDGYWIRTTVQCPRCGSTAQINLNLDGRDQRAVTNPDSDISKLFG